MEKICQQTGQTIQVIDELVRISTAHQKHLCSDAESVAVNEQAYSEKMETMRQIVDELFQIKISADSISNNPEYSSAIKLMQAHIKQLKRVWQCEVNSNRILQSLLSEHKANIRDFREQQQLNSDRLKSDIVNQELKDALFRERKELSAQRSSFLELKAIWDSERSDLTNDNESLREMLRIQYSEAEMNRRGRLEAERSLYDLQKEYKSLEESLFEVKKKNREDREDLFRRFKSKLLEMKAVDHSEGLVFYVFRLYSRLL